MRRLTLAGRTVLGGRGLRRSLNKVGAGFFSAGFNAVGIDLIAGLLSIGVLGEAATRAAQRLANEPVVPLVVAVRGRIVPREHCFSLVVKKFLPAAVWQE